MSSVLDYIVLRRRHGHIPTVSRSFLTKFYLLVGLASGKLSGSSDPILEVECGSN